MTPITVESLTKAQKEAFSILDKFRAPVLPVLPEGSIDKESVMVRLDCSDRTADKILKRAVLAEELETGVFRKKRYWWPKKRVEGGPLKEPVGPSLGL